MRLRHIEAFQAVMTAGSMNAASKLIHVSQSAISHAISHAEQHLGFALFHRSKGKLVPTVEGMALYEGAVRVFEELESLKAIARNLRQGESGQIRVGAIPSICHEFLPEIVCAYYRQHAGVWCDIRALHRQDIVDALLLREIEVGFDFVRAVHPEIESRVLADTELYAILQQGPQAQALGFDRGEVELDRLASIPFVQLIAADPIAQALAGACRERGIELAPIMEVQTSRMAIGLVERGIGWSIVDMLTARNVDSKRVAVARVRPEVRCALCALHSRSRPRTVMTGQFIAAMEKRLQAL